MTWELKGKYPAILDDPDRRQEARDLFDQGPAMLAQLVRDQLADGPTASTASSRPIPTATTSSSTPTSRGATEQCRFHILRQQWERQGQTDFRSLADYVAPVGLGPRRLPRGASPSRRGAASRDWSRRSRRTTTITTRSWSRPSPTAWPRPLPNCCTSEPGATGAMAATRALSTEDLIAEKYRGIRPAAGYPSCPDHTEKRPLWSLLDVEETAGIRLTESYAMYPAASVSGLYFAHPQARYFAVDLITKDQVENYSARKAIPVSVAERWLAPNLAYEPA